MIGNLKNEKRPRRSVYGVGGALPVFSRGKLKNAALLIVLLHLVILVSHSAAHVHLDIMANTWQAVFIATVIFVAPVLAIILIWRSRQKPGAILLGFAMAGSLVFGFFYHFIAAGPDNACSLSSAGWGGMFRITSVLLAVIEACGCVWCLSFLKHVGGGAVGL